MEQAAEANRILGMRMNEFLNRHKIKRTGIIIADRRVAKIFTDNGRSLDLIATLEPETMDFPKGADNHALGRVASSCSRFIRHRLEPRKWPGEQESINFAHQIAEWLGEPISTNGFERLVLIASPAMLGNIRKAMKKQIRNLVSAEAARNLTKMDERDLYRELKKIVRL